MRILDDLRSYKVQNGITLGTRHPEPISIKFTIAVRDELSKIDDRSELYELINILASIWVEDQQQDQHIIARLTNPK